MRSTSQFVALNLYAWRHSGISDRRSTLDPFVSRYNKILEGHESDPGLKAAFR